MFLYIEFTLKYNKVLQGNEGCANQKIVSTKEMLETTFPDKNGYYGMND